MLRFINWSRTPSPAQTDLFVAKEIGGDAVDLLALFELHACALYDSALRLISEDGRQ
jgi:hypothetical protein